MNPAVTVIVLNWNNASDTIVCLTSLARLTYDNHQLIVVDNGSTDDSVEQITTAFPDVELIVNAKNLGFAAGNNVGLQRALASGADYACMLNNDTEVAADFLSCLVTEAESDPRIGLVGPKMYFFDPRDMIYAAGFDILWEKGKFELRGVFQRDGEKGKVDVEKAQDVDSIPGCGMMYRCEALRKVGLLDPLYYLHFENTDLSLRVKKAGYRTRYVPTAVLYHKGSATLGANSPVYSYYIPRNAFLFFGRWLNGWPRIRAIAFLLQRQLLECFDRRLRQNDWSLSRVRFAAYRLGIRDALRGRYGQAGPELDDVLNRLN